MRSGGEPAAASAEKMPSKFRKKRSLYSDLILSILNLIRVPMKLTVPFGGWTFEEVRMQEHKELLEHIFQKSSNNLNINLKMKNWAQ